MRPDWPRLHVRGSADRYAPVRVARFTLLAAGLLAACASPGDDPVEDLRVATTGTSFGRVPTVSVPFSVVNRGGKTLYLNACGDRPLAEIDRQESGEWTQYSGGYCIAVLSMVPLEVGPGDSIAGRVSLADAGRYRLRLGVSASRGAPATRSALSNPFTVR